MPVKCSNCGEELLGAVNRCWRCGKAFVAPPADTPPVRRLPPSDAPLAQSPTNASADEPLTAELVDSDMLVDAHISAPGEDASASLVASQTLDRSTAESQSEIDSPPVRETKQAPIRRGSPFADPAVARTGRAVAGAAARLSYAPALTANYPQHTAATGGAIGALVLGVLSLLSSFFVRGVGSVFVFAPVFLAMIGIGMGVWGLYSEKRGVALAGLLFCCVALAVAGFFGAVVLFEEINGYSPFESVPADVDGLDAEF